ncbi:hypothetical protein LCGC14_1130330 [marine sediment metagenome]|uniref:Uncharacterized protein n=1 Tax=marine sediment metagenome TaxID=412755 RepID=A0A0F9MP40_9ZZZZ
MKIYNAIIQLIHKYDKEPYFINCGSCEDFANDVVELAGAGEVVWTDELDPDINIHDGHAVILYNSKYYDAECPRGVCDYRQLPLIINQDKTEYHKAMHQTKSEDKYENARCD